MKLIDRLTGRDTKRRIRTLELKLRDQESQIRGLNADILESKRWSGEVSAKLAAINEQIEALGFYKHELDARDSDNAQLVARLLQDNPGIAI